MPAKSCNNLSKDRAESKNLLQKFRHSNKSIIKWSNFQERCLNMTSEIEKNEDSFAFKYKIEFYGVDMIDPKVYYSVIKKPMYLKKVTHKIKTGKYKDEFDFIDDINLIFDNAITFNNKRTKYYEIAKELQIKFNDKATKMMKNLGFCCGSSYKQSLLPVICNGAAKNCFIKLGSVYHTFNEYNFCDNCFKKQDEMIKLENKHAVKKIDFKDKKLTNHLSDLYIKCDLCLKRFHRICVMYFEHVKKEFTCANCSVNGEIKTIKLRASALPQNNCSIFIQNQLNNNGLNKAGKVTIRILSDQVMSTSTNPQYSEFVGEFNISYSNRVLFAFHEINGDDVCFFGVYLQVYDADCSIASNRKSIYLSYLDSVNLKTHVQDRTKIYQQVLLGLFHFYKQQDYKKVCIWSCPPKKRTDYMFNVKPVDQKIPNIKRLTAWYQQLFRIGMMSGVVEEFKNVLQYAKKQNWKNLTDLPYYEGDLLPLRIEDTIKNSIEHLYQMNKKRLIIHMDLNSTFISDDTKVKLTKKLLKIQNWTLKEEIMLRTMKLLKNISTVYFVVILNAEAAQETNTTGQINDNSIKSCEFINNRHKFMEFFVDNFYEFSDVRLSRYSSFMMIYELYKAHGICKVCLKLNVLDDVTVDSLKCQSCRDKELENINKQTQSIEIVEVLMNESVEANNDNLLNPLCLFNDTHDKINPNLNFNMAEVVSFSPTVVIEKLDQEFIKKFLRKNNESDEKKMKKLVNKSKVIKKKQCVESHDTRIVFEELTNNTNHRRKYPARKSCITNSYRCNICILECNRSS